MKTVSIGDRLPKWNEIGCLLHKNGRINWTFMRDMNVGEYMEMFLFGSERLHAYSAAKQYGITITVKREYPHPDLYRVTRVESKS